MSFLVRTLYSRGCFVSLFGRVYFILFFFFFATFSACDLITGHILILIVNDQLNQGFK